MRVSKDDVALRSALGQIRNVAIDSGMSSQELARSLREASKTGSHSCPQLIELEKQATAPLTNLRSIDQQHPHRKTLKSHPIQNLKLDDKPPWKGIGITKILAVLTLSLGSLVWRYGRRVKCVRCSRGTIGGFIVGGVYGFRCCWMYKKNRNLKMIQGRILELPLDAERVKSVTHVLKLMWPFYEPNICKWIMNSLTPMLQELKPHFIKRIHFSSLTFGDIPFDIIAVTVVEESADAFTIDAGVRWHGNAHVGIVIELRGGGLLHPKFKTFKFTGNARIAFTPLVSHFPGFGAMTLCFQAAPTIDFYLDINQSVLSLMGQQVQQFLSSFITDHVFGTVLVWPSRIVIPILPEWQRGKLDRLELHTRGVLRVVVLEGAGLEIRENHDGVDHRTKPFVVLETVPMQRVLTKVLPDGCHPAWKEEHFLKIQELDQYLKVGLFDDHYDPALPSWLSDQRLGRKIGSVSIPVSEIPAGESVDKWYSLDGAEETSNFAVRSKHHGQDILSEMWYLDKRPDRDIRLHLQLTYMPVEDLRQGRYRLNRQRNWSASSHYGLLFVRLIRAYNLPNVDFLSLSDPFCVLSLNRTSPRRSQTIKRTLDPEWRENYEWFNVSVHDDLLIEVFSDGTVVDTPMGFVNIPVSSIATECERDARIVDAILPLVEGTGDVQVELDWVPLDNNLMKRNAPNDVQKTTLKSSPRGHLFVKLLWATNLTNDGFFGLSDVYCLLKVKGNERRSKVARNSSSPIWNENFIWESVQKGDLLEITVWTKGTVQDRLLSNFEAKVEDIIDQEGSANEQTKPLLQRRSLTNSSISFQILWQFIPPCSSRSSKDLTSPDWSQPTAQPPPQKKSFRRFLFYT